MIRYWFGSEELPQAVVATPVEEDAWPLAGVPQSVARVAVVALAMLAGWEQEELPAEVAVEEVEAVSETLQAVRSRAPVWLELNDEEVAPAAVTALEDDEPALAAQAALRRPPSGLLAQLEDELPLQQAVLDEDEPVPLTVSVRRPLARLAAHPEDEVPTAVVVTVVEEDLHFRPVSLTRKPQPFRFGALADELMGSINHPTDIPGCILCLLSETLAGSFADGDPIPTWDDQSGLNNDATQSTGTAQPTFIASHPSFGWPAVRGGETAGTRRLFVLPTGMFSAVTAGELFVVLENDVDSAGGAGNQEGWLLGAGPFGTVYGFPADGNIYADFGTTSRLVFNPTPSLAAIRIYNDMAIAGTKTIWIDGAQAATRASNTVSFPATGSILANWANSAANFLNADWFAVIIYDRSLTSDERALVTQYLRKYQATIPNAPDAPSIIDPAMDGVTFDRFMDIEVEDVSASGGGTGPMLYKIEHEAFTGAGWTTLFDFSSTRQYLNVPVGTFANGSDHRLRATAKQVDTDDSGPGAIRTFTIAHSTTPADAPVLEWDGWCANDELYFQGAAFSSPIPGASLASVEFQAANEADPTFSAPIYQADGGAYTASRILRLTGLAADTTYWARVRYTDDVGNVSEWGPGVRGKTARTTAASQIGTGQIAWSGGLVGSGLIIRDWSGQGRHGRHILVTGSDPASFLNGSVTVYPFQFPAGRLVGAPAGFGTDSLAGLLPIGGGQAFCWSTNDGLTDWFSTVRHDGVAGVLPDFGILVVLLPYAWPSGGFDDEVIVLGEARDQVQPITTSPICWIRVSTSGMLYMIRNTGAAETFDLVQLELGVPTLVRISHKYTTEGGARSLVVCNGVTCFDGTPWTNSFYKDFGHFRLGRFGSGDIAAPQNFHGGYTEAACWWNESDLDHTNASDLPQAASVGADPASILAATVGQVLYWRHVEPGRPNQPTITVNPP